jgi:predicted nucleotidyltransferase
VKISSILAEDAVTDLEKDLKNPSSYDAIDHMMTAISKKNKITPKKLHDEFVDKHDETPDDWMKGHINESTDTSDLLEMLKRFLPIVQEHLQLKSFPKIKPVLKLNHGQHPSFGMFVNETNTIELAISNRHPVDILRTLAHELVHCKQREDNRLKPDSGETGSEEENEANALAGVIMRDFDDANPEVFDETPLELSEGTDYVKGNVEYHDTLSHLAWQNNSLKKEVRTKLLEIAKVFVEYIDVPSFEISDIVLTGSMANFNYTEYSDFDLHIVTDYANVQCEDLAEALYQAKKRIWNDNHDIKIYGHEVEVYVEDIDQPPVSSGMFSILSNKWIKEPKHNTPEFDKDTINTKVTDLIFQIDRVLSQADDPSDIERLIEKLRKMRVGGLDIGGEYNVENLSYKVLRNLGYIQKIYDAYYNLQDMQLSLDEGFTPFELAIMEGGHSLE